MGVEDIFAWLWRCDYCGRTHLLQGSDEAPPLGWTKVDILAFCCHSHYSSWLKTQKTDD